MIIDLKDVVVSVTGIALIVGVFLFGFALGRQAERPVPKLEIVKGADCPLPRELEVLVLMVSRDDSNHMRHRCTTVMRWPVDPS